MQHILYGLVVLLFFFLLGYRFYYFAKFTVHVFPAVLLLNPTKKTYRILITSHYQSELKFINENCTNRCPLPHSGNAAGCGRCQRNRVHTEVVWK